MKRHAMRNGVLIGAGAFVLSVLAYASVQDARADEFDACVKAARAADNAPYTLREAYGVYADACR